MLMLCAMDESGSMVGSGWISGAEDDPALRAPTVAEEAEMSTLSSLPAAVGGVAGGGGECIMLRPRTRNEADRVRREKISGGRRNRVYR